VAGQGEHCVIFGGVHVKYSHLSIRHDVNAAVLKAPLDRSGRNHSLSEASLRNGQQVSSLGMEQRVKVIYEQRSTQSQFQCMFPERRCK
jgi:hypothetical protein